MTRAKGDGLEDVLVVEGWMMVGKQMEDVGSHFSFTMTTYNSLYLTLYNAREGGRKKKDLLVITIV